MDETGMSSEELAQVRRYHDAWVQKGELELRTEKLRALRATGVVRRHAPALESKPRERRDLLVRASH